MESLRLQIVSDLHMECSQGERPNPLDYFMPYAEILVMAGDIGSWYKFSQFVHFMRETCKLFKYVIFVAGNHEYYRVLNRTTFPMYKLRERMVRLSNIIPNLYFLDRDSIKFDNICIIGCTLWSDWDKNEEVPKFIVRIIGMNGETYHRMHKKDLKYIEEMIEYCQQKNLRLVVITHHPPSKLVLSESKSKYGYSKLYYTDLDHLLQKDKVDVWICGHVHNNFDFITEGGTRLVGNQKGKIKDDLFDYSPQFYVDIENTRPK